MLDFVYDSPLCVHISISSFTCLSIPPSIYYCYVSLFVFLSLDYSISSINYIHISLDGQSVHPSFCSFISPPFHLFVPTFVNRLCPFIIHSVCQWVDDRYIYYIYVYICLYTHLFIICLSVCLSIHLY